MPLPALDLLPGVVAAAVLADGVGGFDRLGVDDRGGWLRAAAGQDADGLAQLVMHAAGGAGFLPGAHVVVHGAPVRQVSGHRPPYRAVVRQVADRVDDVPAAVQAG